MCVGDVHYGRLLRRLHGPTERVLSGAIDDAGVLGVTGGADRVVRIWRLAGESPARTGQERLGRLGAGLRVGLDEWATLLWGNRRTRKACVIPLVALAVGVTLAGFGDGNFPTNAAVGSVLAALILYWVTWRHVLRTDDRQGGAALRSGFHYAICPSERWR